MCLSSPSVCLIHTEWEGGGGACKCVGCSTTICEEEYKKNIRRLRFKLFVYVFSNNNNKACGLKLL